jgi:hypothetical protein
LTEKETRDYALAVQLKAEGKIKTPRAFFELLRKAKYEALIKRRVFVLIYKNNLKVKGKRIFKSRIVDIIKRDKESLYKKSRLVV